MYIYTKLLMYIKIISIRKNSGIPKILTEMTLPAITSCHVSGTTSQASSAPIFDSYDLYDIEIWGSRSAYLETPITLCAY